MPMKFTKQFYESRIASFPSSFVQEFL